MLSLWGAKYHINDCTPDSPIYSPSRYTKLELVYMAANATA
ncbi:hypothetical protein sp82g_4 [Bacillus phage SP82G]|nr:hypothetical protein sp82g_4 [Bacillus phage SP82G]